MTDPIRDAVDELVPTFQSVEGNWQRILDAASARRPRRRLVRAWHVRGRRTPLLVAAALLAVTAVATAAVAAALGGFNGLGAAQHPPTGADVVDPATAAYLRSHDVGIQLDTVRRVGRLPNGQNVYVVTGTSNDLCTVVEEPVGEPIDLCGEPLSDAHPVAITGDYAVENDPSTRWIIYGLARDGVTSVSFQPAQANNQPAGPEVTVPVKDNLWIYRSNDALEPDFFQPFKAHLADGTTLVEPATGANCAAC